MFICYVLFFFGFFMMDDFVGVMYVFVFVRFWWMEVVNFGSNLIDQLFVDIFDQDIGLVGGFSDDVGWQFVINWMGEVEGQGQYLVFGLCFVINVDQLEFVFEVLVDVDYYVVYQSMGGISYGVSLLVVVMCSKMQFIVVLDYFD